MLGLPDGVVGALFDLDGVLTRTATVHQAAWKQAFDAFLPDQRPFDDTDYQRYVDGKRREDGVRDFLASRGLAPTEETVLQLGNRKNQLLLEMIRTHGVEVYDGSRRYLQACVAAGLRRAVVSSSANTEAVLKAGGLDHLVEVRVDGITAQQDGLRGKPAPDTFLDAARRLGLQPAQCAVFEDALAGVEAGRAGGFGLVVGVDRVGQGQALRDHGADVVVQDLDELL